MIARSGNMQIAPMTPVKVIRGTVGDGRRALRLAAIAAVASRRVVARYNGGFRHRRENAT